MVNTKDIIVLVSMTGELLRNISKEADWELEEVKGSTNRLTVEIPLSDSFGVTTDQELLFRGKRYIISEVSSYRGSMSVTIYADEAQVELSAKNIKKFSLKKAKLSDAISKAVSGSKWTVGTVFADTKEYYAELENQSSMFCLTFLENQSGGKLVFDSANRTVSMEKVSTDLVIDKLFRYKKNVDDISKTEIQPQATIMYPYGKDGMTIESVNNDVPYIEDFSWYTNLGVDLADAKAKYSKEYVWEDERYIFPNNLLTDAVKKLATMSHPQINYTIKASGLEAEELSLNEAVYVMDDELGIKLKTVVSRLKICKDKSGNEVELDYLPASLSDLFNEGTTGDSSGSSNTTAVFQVKNQSKVTLTSAPTPVLEASVSVYTSTYFQVGLVIMLECTTAGLLEGYIMMDGVKMPTEIKQTVGAGWHTIGLPFIMTQIQEGTKSLYLYLSTTGAMTIDTEKSEMFIMSQGAYGGVSNERPDQKVVDDVTFIPSDFSISDIGSIKFYDDLRQIATDAVPLYGDVFTMTDGAYFSVEKLTVITRENFAKVANYPDVTLIPSQLEVDSFIDSLHYNSKVFKVVMIGDKWQVVATTGLLIYVDTVNKVIYSDGDLSTLSVDGILVYSHKIDYSLETGLLEEYEFYTR